MNKREISKSLRQAEEICQQRGARLTAHRRTVLELLHSSERPLSAYEILEQMRATTPNPSPPIVYRALDFLLDQGLAHKIESLHAYMGCSHPGHTHCSQFLICDDCGKTSEIENPEIRQGLESAEARAGFTTKRPVVEVLGTCAHCSGRA